MLGRHFPFVENDVLKVSSDKANATELARIDHMELYRTYSNACVR
jgi:hypothetical protein